MNVELLRTIQKRILQKPNKFSMSTWMNRIKPTTTPTCSTTCCIGGWALAEKGFKITVKPDKYGDLRTTFYRPTRKRLHGTAENEARRILQLDVPTAQQLFYTHSWPSPFAALFNSAPDKATEAAIAVARIEHFISTGE